MALKFKKKNWEKIANEHALSIEVNGIPALASFVFSENHSEYKTYITQEMLKKGFLASTTLYASVAHDEIVIDSYLNALNEVFFKIGKCKRENESIFNLLENQVCDSGFKRLN